MSKECRKNIKIGDELIISIYPNIYFPVVGKYEVNFINCPILVLATNDTSYKLMFMHYFDSFRANDLNLELAAKYKYFTTLLIDDVFILKIKKNK